MVPLLRLKKHSGPSLLVFSVLVVVIGCFYSSVTALDPTTSPNLLAYWDFEPARISGTTIMDRSSNGKDATLFGNLTFAPNGLGNGQAALFDGSSSMKDTRQLFFFYYDDVRGDHFQGQINIFPSSTWYHFAASYDSSTVRQYINGQLITTDTYTASSKIYGSGGVLTLGKIGSIEATTYPWFNGLMDEVMIFDIGLTQGQIQSYGGPMGCGDGYCAWGYETPSTCPQDCVPTGIHPNIIGHWSFDSNQRNSTYVFDQAGAVRTDGKLYGDVQFVPGRVGDAAHFNGVDSVIEMVNPKGLYDGMSKLTVAFYAKVDDVTLGDYGSKMQIVAAADAWESWFVSMYFQQMTFRYYNASRTDAYPTAQPILAREWFHYAFVYDGSTCKTYIDGRVLQNDVCPGGDPSEGYDHFEGYLDELMIFDTALSQAEINSLGPMGCGDGVCLTGFENSMNCVEDCFDTALLFTDSSMKLWWADTMLKVHPSMVAPTTQGGPMLIKLAKNEARFVQIGITPSSDSQIAISYLNPNNGIRVQMYHVDTMTITHHSVNPRTVFRPIGAIPDPLINTSSITLKNSQSTSVMVEVYTSNTTQPGTYQITANIGGASVLIDVFVYDFTVPHFLSLKTSFGINDLDSRYSNATCTGLSPLDMHGFSGASDTAKNDLTELYFNDMAQNRMSSFAPAEGWYLNNYYDCGTKTLNPAKFDAEMFTHVDALGMNAVMIFGPNKLRLDEFPLCGYDINTDVTGWSNVMAEFLTKVAVHLESNGWLNKSYIFINEPYDDAAWANTQIMANVISTRVNPRLLFGPGGGNNEDVDRCPDCNLRVFINDSGEPYRRLIARPNVKASDEIWWYYIRTPHMNLDAEGSDHVVWGWKPFPFNIKGLLTWGGQMFDMSCGSQFDPQYLRLWDSIETEWGNGAVTFYYPPCRTGNCPAPNYAVTPSLRTKLWREGFQDHEYMVILRDLISAKKLGGVDTTLAEAALNRVNEVIYGAYEWANHPRLMKQIREQIAAEIVRLSTGSYPPNASPASTAAPATVPPSKTPVPTVSSLPSSAAVNPPSISSGTPPVPNTSVPNPNINVVPNPGATLPSSSQSSGTPPVPNTAVPNPNINVVPNPGATLPSSSQSVAPPVVAIITAIVLAVNFA